MENEVINHQSGYISVQLIVKYRSLFVFVFLLFLIVVNLEVAELIRVLGGSNNAQPIPQVVFLQVLLGKILQVTLAKRHSRGKDNLVLVDLVTLQDNPGGLWSTWQDSTCFCQEVQLGPEDARVHQQVMGSFADLGKSVLDLPDLMLVPLSINLLGISSFS